MQLIGALNKELDAKPYLYRIELLDRFYKMLDNKELVFVRPGCWSDPLENIIFNATMLKNGMPFEHPAKKNIYGQCWSYEGDSYALWQIYTTKANNKGITQRHAGIRITTHLGKLKQIARMNKGRFYYGLVNYLWKKDLDLLPANDEFIRGLKMMKLNKEHLKTLLVKRRSYSYENELRLLAVPNETHIDKKRNDLCRLKIEPTQFITSMLLDPALSPGEVKKVKETLIDKYGFAATQIKQSSMARKNSFVFNLDK